VTPIDDLFDVAAASPPFRRIVGEPRHADSIGSFAFRATRPFDLARLDAFLASIVDLYGAELLRYKGVLDVAGRDARVIFQGVQTLQEVEWGARWRDDETRMSALVFIGRDLPRALLERGLERCLVAAQGSIVKEAHFAGGAS
jgi:G3E family GTPase